MFFSSNLVPADHAFTNLPVEVKESVYILVSHKLHDPSALALKLL